jgi:TonB family protein
MTAKKFIIPFILASIAGHALVLALTSRVDWTLGSHGERPKMEKVMAVELKESPKSAVRPTLYKPVKKPQAAAVSRPPREDSVALEGGTSPYGDYLLLIRRKIERLWRYPPQALAQSGEGDAVIHFTIEADGALAEYYVTATSGSPILDEGALAVIRAAAPYGPIPEAFNLSRLHITATFRYRMDD